MFMNMMKANLKQKTPTEAAIRERYTTQQARYVEADFTYNTHMLLKRISENGQKEPYMYGIPLYKIMLQVVKIMMMNELETLFLGSTLQEMKWKITDTCLNEYIDEAEDITPRLEKDQQSKKVQFSMLLIAYIVKIYLNEDNSLIDFKIRDIIKTNFDRMYQIWVQRVQNNFKFNPKNMNRLFKEFDYRAKDNTYVIVDYNKLVSEFFRQNQGTSFHEDLDYVKPNQEEHYYPANYPQNQIQGLPVEEEIPVPQDDRRYRLNRQSSEMGFFRRQSGNQFFTPESNKKNPFGLEMIRSSSIVEESPMH